MSIQKRSEKYLSHTHIIIRQTENIPTVACRYLFIQCAGGLPKTVIYIMKEAKNILRVFLKATFF